MYPLFMFHPEKGQNALRRGRASISGASYFLTICTERRKSGLHEKALSTAILAEAGASTSPWFLRTAVIMPDHIHLVVELYASANLHQAVRLFKGRSSVVLRQWEMKWQSGYFDHQIRCNEDALPIFLYVFLNPYQEKLLPAEKKWPGYYCAPDDWNWFGSLTNSALPFPEWLNFESRHKAAPTAE